MYVIFTLIGTFATQFLFNINPHWLQPSLALHSPSYYNYFLKRQPLQFQTIETNHFLWVTKESS